MRNLWSEASIKFQRVVDPWEIFAINVYLSASGWRSRIREIGGYLSLIEIWESEAWICPVETIQTYFEWNSHPDQSIWRRLANNSDSGVEIGSYNLISETTVWHNTVLGLESEVVAWHLDLSATDGETMVGIYGQNSALSVVEKFNSWRLVVIKRMSSTALTINFEISAHRDVKGTSSGRRECRTCESWRTKLQTLALEQIVTLSVHHRLINTFDSCCILSFRVVPIRLKLLIIWNDVQELRKLVNVVWNLRAGERLGLDGSPFVINF